MYKKSIGELAKLFMIDVGVGIALGVFVSVPLSLGKILPDTMESALLVVIPVTVLYFLFRMNQKYNSIVGIDNGVELKSAFGKKRNYTFSEYQVSLTYKEYQVYSKYFAYGTLLVFTNKATGKSKTIKAFGYDANGMQQIGTALANAQVG